MCEYAEAEITSLYAHLMLVCAANANNLAIVSLLRIAIEVTTLKSHMGDS